MRPKKTTESLPQRKTRLFAIEWDAARFTTLDDKERLRIREAEGVHFANGLVALSNGTTYDAPKGMNNLRDHFNVGGYYRVTYPDNGESLTNEGFVDRSPRQPVKKARRA
jgi:hypothetical protein